MKQEIFNNSLELQTNKSVIGKFTAIELFQLYYTPILVNLGAIGNCLSVYVFFKTKLNKLSSSYYLAALAISDTLFLLSLFVVWLNMVQVQLFNKQGMCQIIVYLTGVCSFLSVWFVVAFTVERFIAVRYPLLRQSTCTVSRAKAVILLLLVLAIILFSPLVVFAKVEFIPEQKANLCSNDPQWNYLANMFNVFDTVITFVLPVIIVVILNTCIGRIVWKLQTARSKLTNERLTTTHFKYPTRTWSTYQNKMTKMLLMVSTICLCLNFPSYVMRILTYLLELKILTYINYELFLTLQHCSLQFFNTNFGINFLIYCICGQNFRNEIKQIFCRNKNPIRKRSTVTVSRTRSSSSASRKKTLRRPEEIN